MQVPPHQVRKKDNIRPIKADVCCFLPISRLSQKVKKAHRKRTGTITRNFAIDSLQITRLKDQEQKLFGFFANTNELTITVIVVVKKMSKQQSTFILIFSQGLADMGLLLQVIWFSVELITYARVQVPWYLDNAIYKDKEMVRLSSYKFIIILGLLDSSQLVIHAMSGVFTIAQSTFDPQLNKVLGALLDGCFVSYSNFTFILALNRFTLIISPSIADILFNKKIITVWYFLGGIVLFLVTVLLLTDKAASTFNIKMWCWQYDYDLQLTAWYGNAQMALTLGCFAIAGAFYFIIFVTIIFKVLIDGTRMSYFIMELLWMGNCAVNPFMAICLNQSIRNRIGFQRREKTTHVDPATTTNSRLFTKNANSRSLLLS
ncbi:serpentine type 7TM GPCR chemoreceptor srt domain-containing protein [Ditylenchus destructor]|uniref:Serpentine type 7TM GPCR chemoreceptor srt domain-containing protein n=1 Tax=Ditylenchus destructor TaxID=166010 RepID=A0AAD4NB01_9BILA|nr:serpentine type 7TM GPCR chemoreceptor srt domain-containing protein [Ditylenchus destructor]